MKVCIRGAAEDVELGDIQEVCVEVDRDGRIIAKAFGATSEAIHVDTGHEQLEHPEEAMDEELFEGAHPSVERIVAQAIARAADMIICGDTGRNGLKRIVLGPVAETVVKGSPTPVFVVKRD